MAVPQVQNDPVYSLPFLYLQGLAISVASITTLSVAAGQARDSNDMIDMPLGSPNIEGLPSYPVPLIINGAINGVNGLDTGALGASLVYNVYLIGDSRYYKEVAGLISLASNAFPLIPFGYDSYRLIGSVSTNGSINFNPLSVIGSGSAKTYFLQPEVQILSAGAATTFTAISLGALLPASAIGSMAILDVSFTPNAAGNNVVFRPSGSALTTNLPEVIGQVAAVPVKQQIQVLVGSNAGVPSIDYENSAASGSTTVYLYGYVIGV